MSETENETNGKPTKVLAWQNNIILLLLYVHSAISYLDGAKVYRNFCKSRDKKPFFADEIVLILVVTIFVTSFQVDSNRVVDSMMYYNFILIR